MASAACTQARLEGGDGASETIGSSGMCDAHSVLRIVEKVLRGTGFLTRPSIEKLCSRFADLGIQEAQTLRGFTAIVFEKAVQGTPMESRKLAEV